MHYRVKELKYAAISVPGRMEEVLVMFNVVTCFKFYQSTSKMQLQVLSAVNILFICESLHLVSLVN